MLNKEFIKKTFLKELDFYSQNSKVDYLTTPLLYKIHLDLDEPTFIKYLKNFHHWILKENDFGYLMLDKMFTFKEVPFFKIQFKDKTYRQKDYSSAIAWIKHFLQDDNFTSEELLKFQGFTLTNTENYSKLEINGTPIFFQHRWWGLDHMNKDKANQNAQRTGWGRLKTSLEELNPNIIFTEDGSEMRKMLNNTRNNQYYP